MFMRFYFTHSFSSRILFVNQNTYYKFISKNFFKISPQKCCVWYTHFSDNNFSRIEQAKLLGKAKKIFVYNSSAKAELANDGVPKKNIEVVYGAINRTTYYPQSVNSKDSITNIEPYVLIVGECKKRKNPDLILRVIKFMKNRKFIIHGNGWENFISVKSHIKLPNLEIVKFNISDNPRIMRFASTYLSLSYLEGGPYPTLEALASGTPVVVTDTGWNKEIVSKSGGIVVPVNVTLQQAVAAVNKTIKMKEIVKNTDLLFGSYTWEALGNKVYD
jgi:glycosyltransferase involved in cell wall biosynthesis